MGRGPNTRNTSCSVVSDNAFNIQVGMERPSEMVPRSPGEVLMEYTVARTVSEECPGYQYLRTGQGRQQAHSNEACRKRIEARLAAADVRIHRALADAVERHVPSQSPTRKLRRTLNRVCPTHTSLPRKIIKFICTTHRHASNDPNTGTGDVTGDERTRPTQDSTRTISEDDIGGNVAMM